MSSMNKVIILGRVGKAPDVRRTQNDMCIVSLSVATSEKKKDQTGNWTEATEWHKVNVFGKQAENVAKYVEKGSQVMVEGKLKTDSWTDNNGQKKYSTGIVANNVVFISKPAQAQQQQNFQPPVNQLQPQPVSSTVDIPF